MTDVEGAKPQLKPVIRILPSRMVIHHHNDVFMNPGYEFPGRGVIGKLKKSIQLSDHLARTVRFFTFNNPPRFIVSQEFFLIFFDQNLRNFSKYWGDSKGWGYG